MNFFPNTSPPSSSGVSSSRRTLRIVAWTLYDAANTGFSVMIVTFGYALYFQGVVAAGRDAYWGIAVSVSMAICALIAPPLGAVADAVYGKKRFLAAFTALSVLSTLALYWVAPGMILAGIVLFTLANVGFESGIVFYDALLPELAESQEMGRISGYGFAMGYLGAIAILALCFPFLQGGLREENLPMFRLSFVVTAAFFAVLAAPLFFLVPEKRQPQNYQAHKGWTREFAAGAKRSFQTLRHLRSYPALARFLAAFFLYNDGILTVVAFASIFARSTLGFDVGELLVFFLAIQFSAAAGSLAAGFAADKIGARLVILAALLLWISVCGAAVAVSSKTLFYLVGIVAGLGLGASSSASRTFMAQITPKDRATEFFGFYDGFFGKASAIAGPLVFGFVSDAFGQRAALGFLSLFFIAGFALMASLRTPPQTEIENPARQ
jgi:UMF1 family MFS transporter